MADHVRHEFRITVPVGGVARSYPAWLDWFRLVPYRFRRAHRWWAWHAGFFWLPCPLCDQPFGGHEWRDIRGLPSTVPDPTRPPLPHQGGPVILLGGSVGICPRCTQAGRGIDG